MGNNSSTTQQRTNLIRSLEEKERAENLRKSIIASSTTASTSSRSPALTTTPLLTSTSAFSSSRESIHSSTDCEVLLGGMTEVDSSELQHYTLKHLWQGNFVAPVRDLLQRGSAIVLDVGCGSGIWVNEMARDYGNCHFIGISTDSPDDFPDQNSKPSNAHFSPFEITKGIPYMNNIFDFVHVRFVGASFTNKQYKDSLLKEIVRVTKVGGTIELFESDFKWSNKGPTLARLLGAYRSWLSTQKMDPYLSSKLGRYMKDTGRIGNIHSESRWMPLGSWRGGLGERAREAVKEGFESTKAPLAEHMGISEDEYDRLLAVAIQEFDRFEVSMPTIRWYGTKIKRRKGYCV